MSYKVVQKREIPSNLQKHHSVPTKETPYPNSKRMQQQQNSKFSTSPITKTNSQKHSQCFESTLLSSSDVNKSFRHLLG